MDLSGRKKKLVSYPASASIQTRACLCDLAVRPREAGRAVAAEAQGSLITARSVVQTGLVIGAVVQIWREEEDEEETLFTIQ